ncbi:MAG: FAD-binding oxidoreductase [Roseiflexaceae bacterium]|nr:FAD-binding oxidoreductase [Roseiflexaceae bacterium]
MTRTYSPLFDLSALPSLRSRIQGRVFVPGDDGYEQASLTWETVTFKQRPPIVVVPAGDADVLNTVRFAREYQMPVAVQGGGHGHPFLMEALEREQALLLNFASMKNILIDPQRATARVEPGVKWSELIPLAHQHGLAPLNGFAGDVGVSGYLLGGGFGWLVRQYGLGAGSICSLQVVTADGQSLRVDAHTNADLFWGMRGGGANLGIATSIEFALYPVKEVFGGQVIYPIEQSRQVIAAYMQWAKSVPETLTSTFRIMQFPPLPGIPPVLQGKAAVIIVGCYNGSEADGTALFHPMRTLGQPLLDTFAQLPYSQVGAISNDPVDAPPWHFYNDHTTLRDFSTEQIDALVVVAADPASGLFEVEMRHLGGVLARIPEHEMAASLRDVNFSLYALAAAPTTELLAAGRQSVERIMEATPSDTSVPVLLNALAFNDVGPERTRAAYTPDNYRRLVALKNSYDPQNMFRFNNNIPPSP